MGKTRACHKGFTLFELMLTMAIIGMILGIATTSIDFLFPRSRLRAAARAISSTIALGYNRAAVLGQPVAIHYHLGQKYHRLILPPALPGGNAEPLTNQDLPNGVRYEDIVTAQGTKYTPGSGTEVKISITPMGTIVGHAVHLINDQGEQITIEINPITGIVNISSGYKSLTGIEK